METEIIPLSEFNSRLSKRAEVKRLAMKLKKSIAASNRLAIQLLAHPDATPEAKSAVKLAKIAAILGEHHEQT